ncbi:MAG TPA: hypothetical protein VN310_11045 [Candidatus Dormibacteraeota bacterium]|nr:hypothetical protein [Candidatus Dormibacteraeota bacterium]
MDKLVRRAMLIVLVTFISFISHAEMSRKPLFIRAKCDGRLSSTVLSALKEAVRASQEYELVGSLDDNGRLDTVQTIYMTCVENHEVTAIATQFGIAQCKSTTVCHSAIDGLSLNAALCNANLSADCGRALFKTFDAYIRRPNPTPLKIE